MFKIKDQDGFEAKFSHAFVCSLLQIKPPGGVYLFFL